MALGPNQGLVSVVQASASAFRLFHRTGRDEALRSVERIALIDIIGAMRTTIHFLTSGETNWDRRRRLEGQQDSLLTAIGREQAQANGMHLLETLEGRPLPRCLCSPLGRCRETAAIVCGILGKNLFDLEFDDRLKDQSLGDWEGMKIHELGSAKVRSLDQWDIRPPNGESCAMVAARLQSWLSDIDGQIVIAVSHERVERVLRSVYAGMGLSLVPSLGEGYHQYEA